MFEIFKDNADKDKLLALLCGKVEKNVPAGARTAIFEVTFIIPTAVLSDCLRSFRQHPDILRSKSGRFYPSILFGPEGKADEVLLRLMFRGQRDKMEEFRNEMSKLKGFIRFVARYLP